MRCFPSRSLFSSFLLSGVAFFALCASLSCGSGSEIVSRLEARLKDTADSGRQEATPDEIEQAIASQLRVAPVPAKGSEMPSSPTFPTRQTLREFYANRGQSLAWCDESGVTLPSVRTFLEALSRAEEHGLDPEDYGLSSLERMGQSMLAAHESKVSVAHWADFDLLMTTAFFRYASDLSTGRVHPDEIRTEWHTEFPEPDLPASLDRALQEGSLEKLLERLPPPHPGYAQLREGLMDLRSVEDAGGWPVVSEGPDLKRGARGPRVATLKQRLLASANDAPDREIFDAALDERVRVFQRLHGIEPDGVVSKSTLAELNVPVERRIRQVGLNMERWRWIPRHLGEPYVEVNIPGFELKLVRDGRAELRSRIVVGQAFTPTPVFNDQIVAVVANPPWNVPETLAVREYLPELKEDPQGFLRHGIRIYENAAEDEREVDPASVRWARVDEDEFKYHLRQDPGPDNALGQVKFQLTNDFQIYLHDTPARTLFAQTDRDLSHGCIRVEKARDLANEILGDSSQKLEEALESEEEKHIQVRPPVQVQILYLTAWMDEEGALRFSPDVYEFDVAQLAALDRASRAASSDKRKL